MEATKIPDNWIRPLWERLDFKSQEAMDNYGRLYGLTSCLERFATVKDTVVIEAKLEAIEAKLDKLIVLVESFARESP